MTLNFNILQEVQVSHMGDTCTIKHITVSGYNSYGEPEYQITLTSGIPCGIENTGGVTQYKGQYFATPVDVILRLPAQTAVTIHDRIMILDEEFEVVSHPQAGKTATRIHLKKVTF
jgi:hypothetical protein